GEIKTPYLKAFDAHHPRDAHPWMMSSPSSIRTRLILEENSELLSTIASVNQGIKTGANDIFIVTPEPGPDEAVVCRVRNGLGDTYVLERDCVRPVVFGGEIQRYSRVRAVRMLVYPYEAG